MDLLTQLNTKAWIGIDPGITNGGTAVLFQDGRVQVTEHSKTTLQEYCSLMEEVNNSNNATAMLEKVHAMPSQGVTSMFSFGQEYGHREMALIALEVRFERVAPQKWQAEFGLLTPKKSKEQRAADKLKSKKQLASEKSKANTVKKNLHKSRAQELFPGLKVVHWMADALLIAEYCRRTDRGVVL